MGFLGYVQGPQSRICKEEVIRTQSLPDIRFPESLSTDLVRHLLLPKTDDEYSLRERPDIFEHFRK